MATHKNLQPLPDRTDPPPVSRRRRRWPWIVLGVTAGLVVLVAMLPYLLSTGPVRNYIAASLSDSIRGRIEIDDIRLSWNGPTVISGLRLYEPRGQMVSSVQRLRWERGVLGAIGSPSRIGQVTVEEPALALVVQPEGGLTLAQAVEPAKPGKEQPDRPLPRWFQELTGQLRIRSGSITITLPRGQPYALQQVQADVDINTLANITNRFSLALPEGGAISGQADIRQLLQDGQVRPAAAEGTLHVQSDRPVALGPVLSMLTGQARVQGLAQLSLDAQLARQALQAGARADVQDLLAAGPGYVGAQPMDVHLAANVDASQERLAGQAEVTSPAGQTAAQFDFQTHTNGQAGALQLTAKGLSLALLSGQDVAMPPGELTVQGQWDLARLAQAVPGLLKLRPDVTITQGQLALRDVKARTGQQSSFAGKLDATDLTADVGGKSVSLQPMRMEWDAALAPREGLRLEQVSLQTGFASLQASGTARQLAGSFNVSLHDFQRQLGQIVPLGEVELAGTLSGTAQISGSQDQPVTSLEVRATDLVYRTPGMAVRVPQAVLTQNGRLEISGGSLARVVTDPLQLSVADVLTAQARGWAAPSDQTFQLQYSANITDLGRLLGMVDLPALRKVQITSSATSLEGQLSRSAAGQEVEASSKAVVKDLRRQGRLLEDQAVLEVESAGLAPRGGPLTAQRVSLRTSTAQVQASDIRYQPRAPSRLSGQVELSADLDRAMQLTGALTGNPHPPQLGGQLAYSGKVDSAGQTINLTGQGSVDDLAVVTADGRRVRQGRVEFAHDAGWQPAQHLLELREARLQSLPLKLTASGQLADYAAQRHLDLRGNYSLSWDDLMPVLSQLAPKVAEVFSLSGASSSEFSVTGPLNLPGPGLPYRDLAANGALGWTSGLVYGMAVGAATLQPRMRNGMVELPTVEVPAGAGWVRLSGRVNLTGQEPALEMDQPLQVLQRLPVDPDVGAKLLSRFNPVFARLAGLQGQVDLSVSGISLPLGKGLRTAGKGQGRLSLGQMQMQGGDLWQELLRLLGSATPSQTMAVRFTDMDFQIRDGAIHYDNFGMVLAEGVNLVFRGRVGFDDTVDLWVSLPVTPEVLRRAGVSGPAAQYAQALSGARIEIPVVGTRMLPRLDLSRLDIRPLVRQAAQRILQEQLERGIGLPVPAPSPSGQETQPVQTQPSPPHRPRGGQEVLGELLDLLQKESQPQKEGGK